MKKLLFFCFLFVTAFIHCRAQGQTGDVTDVTKITILNPGFSYEKRIGKFQTIFLQAFMNTSSATSRSIYGTEARFYFDPAVTAQYRYYYNFNRRSDKGLRTALNNLNYVTAVWQTFFSRLPLKNFSYEPQSRRAVNLAALARGIQRNFIKRFALDLNVGPGVLFTNTTFTDYDGITSSLSQSQFTLFGQLNIGIWLNSRDKNPE
jgi:hypothetical protein